MNKEVIFLRHGETEYNLQDRLQGHLDTQLSANGRKQILDSAQKLAEYKPVRIYSSDLSRAAETAQALGDLVGVTPILDKRLRETDIGEWQGLSKTELDTKYPGQRLAWLGDAKYAPPGGESKLQVAERFMNFWNSIDDQVEGLTVVVSHGGLISTAVSSLLGIEEDSWHIFRGLSNASWGHLFWVEQDKEWKLRSWNPLYGNLAGSL